jgi:hypothetical protein
MDVVPQQDPKISNTRWSKPLEGRLQTPPAEKGKKSMDKYFAFGSRQWLCQDTDLVPPWTRTFAVVKDQVLSCLTSIY